MIDVNSCDNFILFNVIDSEDWEGYDDLKKEKILNVANTTLINKYPDYIIPDEAVYEFAGLLSVLFNDINKNQFNGVAGFSITGATSYTFKDATVGQSLSNFIPDKSKVLIGEANNVNLLKSGVRVGRYK